MGGGGPTVDMTGPEDQDMFKNHMEEVRRNFEEPVTVRRWTSNTGGDPSQGVPPTENFNDIKTTANISSLSAQDVHNSNSIYNIGDLNAEFRIRIYGAESEGGDAEFNNVSPVEGRRADRVIYRKREYRIVGHVDRIALTGQTQYYKAVLRQT